MHTAILALLALGLAGPAPAKGKARSHNAKRSKVLKPAAPPLSGSAKTLAIRKATGASNLKAKKVFKVGLDELSPGVRLSFKASVSLGGDLDAPRISLSNGAVVSMEMKGTPGAVYFVDCGVGSSKQIVHKMRVTPGPTLEGVASVTGGRAVFAHALDAGRPKMIDFVFGDAADSRWTFSSCEITELAPVQVKTTPVTTGKATK